MSSTQATSTISKTSSVASTQSDESESSALHATPTSKRSRSTKEGHTSNADSTSNSDIPKRQGLSADTLALAEEVLHPEEENCNEDGAVRPSDSVRWLIESTTEVERATERASALPSLLTEASIRTFNKIEPKRKMFVVEEGDDSSDQMEASVDSQESRRTKAWIMGDTDP